VLFCPLPVWAEGANLYQKAQKLTLKVTSLDCQGCSAIFRLDPCAGMTFGQVAQRLDWDDNILTRYLNGTWPIPSARAAALGRSKEELAMRR
jgi:hypothetical protein